MLVFEVPFTTILHPYASIWGPLHLMILHPYASIWGPLNTTYRL